MDDYISRKAAIAYIREQSEECQKAFEELGGESGIYADAYNDLAEDFYSIPAADVAPVVRCKDCKHYRNYQNGLCYLHTEPKTNARGYSGDAVCVEPDDFCSYGEKKDGGDAEG
jgi:hypothetical protein